MPIGKVVDEIGEVYPSVTPSSLRFLEREGLIVPTRTPGGHRLYSPADVRRILQIKEWQAQRLSLEEIRHRLEQRDRLPDPAVLTETFLEEVLAGNVETARRTVLAADDVGMSLSQTFSEVIEPALIQVGQGWEAGTILVAQEKTVSELVRDLIAELAHRHTPAESFGPVIIAACVSGERHELGLRMIVALLRAEGLRVQYLGADVDAAFLLEAVRLHQPAAVLLSARNEHHLRALEESMARLRNELGEGELPVIVVGGLLAQTHADVLKTLGVVPITGANASEAMQRAVQILEPVIGRTSEGSEG